MSRHKQESDVIGDSGMELRLSELKTEIPEASPQFRLEVMNAIRSRHLLQNQGTWQHLPDSTLRRIVKPVVLILIVAAAAYLGSMFPRTPTAQIASDNTGGLIKVRFMLRDTQASAVYLAGGFSQWEPRYTMHRDRSGVWTAEVPLKPGRYEYMFIINGEKWVTDPVAQLIQDDGYGGRNSVIIVTASDSKKGHSNVEAI